MFDDDEREVLRARAAVTIARVDATLAIPRDPEVVARCAAFVAESQARREAARAASSAATAAAPAAVGARPAAGAFVSKAALDRRLDVFEKAVGTVLGRQTADVQAVVDGLRSRLDLAQQRATEAEARLAALEGRLAKIEAPPRAEVKRLPGPRAA